MVELALPRHWLLGAATAAYQIEGAWDRDGKGESIWDRFAHTPGKIRDGTSGDVATDHHARYQEDVASLRWLGLGAYRFSVSWPRVVPAGTGRVEPRGLDFYDRLVDALLAADVAPVITLYHWDLPQGLEDRGGWANRDVPGWFADYAALVARRLGDRALAFLPLNEPQVFTVLGYLQGKHAPGRSDFPGCLAAMHHANLAHGRAVQAIRAEAPRAKVGTALQLPPVHAATDSEADRVAARRFDGWFNRWFLDPVLLGRYPEDVLAALGPFAPEVPADELATVAEPLDFVGVNYYFRTFVRHAPEVPLFELAVVDDGSLGGAERTAMGWEVYPEGLAETLLRVHRDYGAPALWVTECGCALEDQVDDSGAVDDEDRVHYLARHLAQLLRAEAEGARVEACFFWSLLDNFEWDHGLSKRFGLLHVDYATLRRTPKKSAHWVRGLCAAREGRSR